MQRINFTLDNATAELLEKLAEKYYQGNRSLTVRSALQSLAAHAGHEGWVITGYTPIVVDTPANCHTCGDLHGKGDVLFRPVFEPGEGPHAVPKIPQENWLECSNCVDQLKS